MAPLVVGSTDSVVVACRLSSRGSQALEHRLSNYGTWASLPHNIRSLPRAGIKLMSPALTGRFLTTGPPEKSLENTVLWQYFLVFFGVPTSPLILNFIQSF